MRTQNNQSAQNKMPENVFELSADGVSYWMLLPNADVDYIQRKLASEHVPYEYAMLEDMGSRLTGGDVVIDAGANIGNHSIYLAAVVGCRVTAFEPNARLVEALCGSVQLNGLQEKVEVRQYALGKAAGRGRFAKEIPDNLGAQSIDCGDGPLEIRPLDGLDFPAQVKAIKIDVEGMELDVLEGAEALILRDRPVLYVECGSEASFRQVHHWMTAKNYGYWDTFNATPTHLFLPNEQTSVDQRLSRLQLKAAQETSQLAQQISKTREMLDNANGKYRAATEQVAGLKVQLATEEVVRREAEKAATDAAGLLAQTRDRVEAERGALQQEVLRLGALAESNRQAAQEAEKQLIRLEAALSVVRTDLAVMTAKYDGALAETTRRDGVARELADQLAQAAEELACSRSKLAETSAKHGSALERAQLLNQKAAHDGEATKQLQQQIAQLSSQLADMRDGLAEAKQQYRLAVEQVEELKRKAARDEAVGKIAAEYAAKSNAQLIETQAKLLEDRTALLAEISKLREHGQQVSKETHEVEKQLVRAEVELATAKAALTAANTQYQDAIGQVSGLKQRVVQEEQAAFGAEKLWGEAQIELHQLKSELGNVTASYQVAVERIAELGARIEAETRARENAEQMWEESFAELEGTKVALDQVKQQQRELDSSRAVLAEAHIELEARMATETRSRRNAEHMWEESRDQLELTKAALEHANELQCELNAKTAALTESQGQLESRLTTAAEARQILEQLCEESRAQLESTKAALQQANLKYRQITTEIPQMKAQVQSGQAQVREQQHGLEQLKLELAAGRKALTEANHQLERARQQKMQAEQQVVKTRASLSFQLGYILIRGFKSTRGFLGMPKALLTWRQEVLRRRKQRAQRIEKLQVAAIPAANQRATVAVAVPQVVPEPALLETGMRVGLPASVPMSATAPDQTAAKSAPAPLEQAVNNVVAPRVWPRDLRQLKVACIMDEFTFGSYRAECNLLQLTPANWYAELDGFKPELLFIESAWRGKDELWGSKVGHNSQELQGIVAWCRQHGVPTVFWNKEDPVHFETFLSTATLFDCVFTTDIDCIHRYKASLQHDNVFLLPFACQPRNNHPIETYERKDAFCFAGAYYVRYPDRTRDLGNFVSELPKFRPLEIYDRNFGKNDPNYQFPPEYQQYIVGTLPFDQIDKAYKGYRYAINLNSIKQSQTMFARRVFELMASNTITVSNFSRGARLMFGDLVITTDSGSEVVRHLNAVAGDEVRSAKLRLAALRKVLQEHTYEQRLAYVFLKVSGQAAASRLPTIAVLASAKDQGELDLILENFSRQCYERCRLHVMLAGGFAPETGSEDERVQMLPHALVAALSLKSLASGADFVAGMAAKDYYGPNYLADIALATTYSDAEILGKKAQYAWKEKAVTLQAAGQSYRPASEFAARSAAVRLSHVGEVEAAEWIGALETALLDTKDGLAVDEFNYCLNGQDHGAERALVVAAADDLPGLDTGVQVSELLRLAEGIEPAPDDEHAAIGMSGKKLAQSFGKAPSAVVRVEVDGDSWQVSSMLADGKHEYLYATKDFTVEELGWSDKAEFYFDITPGLNLQLVLVFLDGQNQKIAHAIKHANRNQEVQIPLGTASIRLGLRIYAGGSAEIKGLLLGHRDLQPAEIIGKAERLVLTNHYPSYDDLYRNGFVHTRVVAYRERGLRCDVFRMRPAEPVSYHEFEDVDVTTGSQEVLNQMLASGRYKTVMVHFLEPAMWEVLQQHIDRVKVVVWVHGAEIQPWHRRDYNYSNDEERTVAKMKSDARMAFWRGLLQTVPANLQLVFVSRYFAEEVMEDLGFRIPEGRYKVIHNPIDTEVFSYRPKSTEQRKKVLSIRPYASATYANDLSVKAIQLLSAEPWFSEMEFRLIGDGPLFDETLAPLRHFSNVHIERRFLKRSEIASLHKEYGIFLSPTRMDSQGVSRDEAMASGLVPVTNAVTAIPEFVDEQCGILAPGDDPVTMAKGISALYENPDLFIAMSKAASERVFWQRNKQSVIESEIGLLI